MNAPTSEEIQATIQLAHHLIYRLERLSVDSHWAHQASGVRRSLLRGIDTLETAGENDLAQALTRLERLIRQGFDIAEHGAKELGPGQ